MKKILFYVFIILTLIIITLFIVFQLKQKKLIKEIKNSYNEFVISNKQASIYNNLHEVVGSIYENVYLELDEKEIKNTSDTYFKIKNTNFYIYYKDVNKSDQRELVQRKDYYVDLGKTIKTGDTTNLFQDGEIKLVLNNSFYFNVNQRDDNYYYITYLDQIFQVKNDEIAEISDLEADSISTYISVINYTSVEDSCNKNECTTVDSLKEQLNYLKENGYYTIDIDDYKLWLNDYINLKEKAILITSKQENINEIASEYNMTVEKNFDELTYSDSNSKSEKGNSTIPRYNIIKKTTLDILKKIVDGESVTYVEDKPILQAHKLQSEGSNASSIAVLNYHFFYDPEIGESCPDGNCKTVQDFEQELIFLRNNNYKTLTMDEFTKWMYGEIELPARSVLITVDDGAMGTGKHNGNKLIPLLEKYQMHATLFLITGWWAKDNYVSPYLDIESHTFDMHEGNYCEGVSRGSKLLCSTKEQVLEDLNKSVEVTQSKNAFCFPMYVYNDTTMEVLQEIGFKLAFVGGDTKATRSNNKYKIPRYHIYRTTTLDQFINMVS